MIWGWVKQTSIWPNRFADENRFLEIVEDSKTRVFISMGKASCNQGKFADQRRFLEIVWGILDKVKDGSYLLTPI